MANEDFKSIGEQLEILRSHGLSIENNKKAKDFLLQMNLLVCTWKSLIQSLV